MPKVSAEKQPADRIWIWLYLNFTFFFAPPQRSHPPRANQVNWASKKYKFEILKFNRDSPDFFTYLEFPECWLSLHWKLVFPWFLASERERKFRTLLSRPSQERRLWCNCSHSSNRPTFYKRSMDQHRIIRSNLNFNSVKSTTFFGRNANFSLELSSVVCGTLHGSDYFSLERRRTGEVNCLFWIKWKIEEGGA